MDRISAYIDRIQSLPPDLRLMVFKLYASLRIMALTDTWKPGVFRRLILTTDNLEYRLTFQDGGYRERAYILRDVRALGKDFQEGFDEQGDRWVVVCIESRPQLTPFRGPVRAQMCQCLPIN